MKDLNYVTGELAKGRNLQVNLPAYANSMMSLYNGLAYIKLSMNYYTFFEMANDSEFGKAEMSELKGLLDRFNDVAESQIAAAEYSDDIYKHNIDELEGIRASVVRIMEVVTAYVDRLRIYEYVLNRIEYRFKDEEFDDAYYNNGLTNELMHYILSDKDSVAVNNRISEVVEQLPMRLSKNKFYEYLRDSFSLYKDAQIGTVDDFAYTLGTTGMLAEPEGFEDMFPEVSELYNDIRSADYKNISKEQFDSLHAKLTIAAQKMSDTADMYVMFTQLVNDMYTLVLSGRYVLGDVEETIRARGVIEVVLDDFKNKKDNAKLGIDEHLDDLTDSFISFEGKQERIGETVSANDYAVAYALEHYRSELAADNLTDEYENLAKIIRLQSGSDFMALTEDEAQLENAGKDYVEKVCGRLIDSFAASFETMDRTVRRAVMSAVLSQVPVFFNNIDEIQGYINTSLSLCSDISERQACVEVLKLIMQG